MAGEFEERVALITGAGDELGLGFAYARFLADRVYALSPGPLKTRAASGLKDFDLMLNEAVERAPIGELVDIMDVGFHCAFLATPFGRRVTGGVVYVDGGINIMA